MTGSPKHASDLLRTLGNLTVWKRDSERAPHKPLLLLMTLAGVQRGTERLVPFSETNDPLKELLVEFGPTRRSYHPEYPFWFLQSDGIWEVVSDGELGARKGNTNPTRTMLVEAKACGGLLPEYFDALARDSSLVRRAAQVILDACFPPSIHEDILDAVGLALEASEMRKTGPRRDPNFRTAVLRAYEYACAVCGFDLQIDGHSAGLEAAHVRWHAASGPSTLDNGMALCPLHHKSFDRGFFTVGEGHCIEISSRIKGGQAVEDLLVRHHGRGLRGPQRGAPQVASANLRWHRIEVFKGPARV